MKLLHLTRRYLRPLHFVGYVQIRSMHRLFTFRATETAELRRLNYKVCVTTMDKPFVAYTGKFVRYYILRIMYKRCENSYVGDGCGNN